MNQGPDLQIGDDLLDDWVAAVAPYWAWSIVIAESVTTPWWR